MAKLQDEYSPLAVRDYGTDPVRRSQDVALWVRRPPRRDIDRQPRASARVRLAVPAKRARGESNTRPAGSKPEGGVHSAHLTPSQPRRNAI